MPADALLHPLAVLAVAVLLLNDHVLKPAWPGLVTGKLSDLAGTVFFPLVLLAGYELIQGVSGRWGGPSQRALVVAVAVTAIGFVLVKTTVVGADAFGWALGVGQWLPVSLGAIVDQRRVPPVVPTTIVRDPTDLVALLGLGGALVIGHRRLPDQRTPAG